MATGNNWSPVQNEVEVSIGSIDLNPEDTI